MNRSALTIIPALLLCCAGFCQRAYSQTGQGKKNATAIIAGKVTIKGVPAPGVIVGLRLNQSPQVDSTLKATTDQEGKYQITDVPAGSYRIVPLAPVFVISDVNKPYGQSLIITEGDNIAGIDFDLLRGGVITGKVTDADGHPVVEEPVNLLVADSQRSGAFHVSRNSQTDDRGIYRIFGLRPGLYKVSVGEESLSVVRGSAARRTFPITFHPDVSDEAKAAVVEVGEGTEATNIDIKLAPAARTYAVSGRVIDGATGKAITNVPISLMKNTRIDAFSTSGFGGTTDVRSNSDGEFTLNRLPPGNYEISIEPPPESNLRAQSVAFEIVDDDVAGLLIKTTTGAILSGTVVLERSRERDPIVAAPRWLAVRLRNESLGNSSTQQTEIKSDGSFQIGGLQAGTVSFSVGSWSPMGNATPIPISRVERDGVVQSNGLQIGTGEQISGLRIVVRYASGSIRGVVKVENGTLPPTGHLVVSISKVGDSIVTPSEGGKETDARGRFFIEGLPTGTYEVTVTAYIPEWRRQRPRTTKQLVTVTDGAATDVLLSIDLTPP